MDPSVLNIAAEQGIWAVMFVALLLYILKDSKQREDRLMSFLDEISKQFENLDKKYERLALDVNEIKTNIKDRDRRE